MTNLIVREFLLQMWFATRRAHIQRWLHKDPSEIQDHLDSIYFDFLTLSDAAFHSQDEQRAHTTVPQGAAPYFTTPNTLLQGGKSLGDSFTSETTASITASRQQKHKAKLLDPLFSCKPPKTLIVKLCRERVRPTERDFPQIRSKTGCVSVKGKHNSSQESS